MELGFEELTVTQCGFVYWARDNDGRKWELTGLIAVQVDDLIVAGATAFEAALTKMRGKLSFGKWYVKEFDYLGRR